MSVSFLHFAYEQSNTNLTAVQEFIITHYYCSLQTQTHIVKLCGECSWERDGSARNTKVRVVFGTYPLLTSLNLFARGKQLLHSNAQIFCFWRLTSLSSKIRFWCSKKPKIFFCARTRNFSQWPCLRLISFLDWINWIGLFWIGLFLDWIEFRCSRLHLIYYITCYNV